MRRNRGYRQTRARRLRPAGRRHFRFASSVRGRAACGLRRDGRDCRCRYGCGNRGRQSRSPAADGSAQAGWPTGDLHSARTARRRRERCVSYPKNGEMAKIAMLPWIPEYRIIDSRQMPRPRNEWHQIYSENLAARCSRLADGFATNTINILLAHLFVDGAETTGSERPAHVSQPFAVRPDQLPRAHYIALGHLHKPQEVPTSSPCAYAGSPLQLDFGERGQRKRVAIVDASVESPAVVESIPLVSGRKLRDVVTTIDKLDSVAREAGSDFCGWLSGHGRKYPVCRSRSRRRCRTRSRSIRNSRRQRPFSGTRRNLRVRASASGSLCGNRRTWLYRRRCSRRLTNYTRGEVCVR